MISPPAGPPHDSTTNNSIVMHHDLRWRGSARKGWVTMASDPEVKGLRRLRRGRTRHDAAHLHREQAKPKKISYTPTYYRQLYRRIAGWILVGLGLLVAGSHAVTHLGGFQVLPRVELQDWVMGYPVAGILVVGGVILLGT